VTKQIVRYDGSTCHAKSALDHFLTMWYNTAGRPTADKLSKTVLMLLLKVDTAAIILHGVKIVQIDNITKKPAKIYVLSLYNFDAM
jgi:hypothetical protein